MAKRAVDWTAHAKALRKGQKAVLKAAPSPAEVAGGRHDAMQLAAWGVPWPPEKGWAQKLKALWESQHQAEVGRPIESRPDQGVPAGKAPWADLMKQTKVEMAVALHEANEVIWALMEKAAQLERELQAGQPAAGTPAHTAAQIRLGGMEYERATVIEWLRQEGKPGIADAIARRAHHGAENATISARSAYPHLTQGLTQCRSSSLSSFPS
jgi:hypothetical protein